MSLSEDIKTVHEFGNDMIEKFRHETNPEIKKIYLETATAYFGAAAQAVVESGKKQSIQQVVNTKGDNFMSNESASKFNLHNEGQIASVGDENEVKGNVFNQVISVPENVQNAIESLRDLLNKSSIEDLDKEDAISELDRVNQLAQKEKTPDVVERAKKKIDLLKTALETGGLLVKALPYITLIAGFFGFTLL